MRRSRNVADVTSRHNGSEQSASTRGASATTPTLPGSGPCPPGDTPKIARAVGASSYHPKAWSLVNAPGLTPPGVHRVHRADPSVTGGQLPVVAGDLADGGGAARVLPARPDQEIHRTRDRVCYGAWAASGLCSKSCLYWRKPRLSIAAVPRGGHREWKGKGNKARDVIR
jgi:hypothetical protein